MFRMDLLKEQHFTLIPKKKLKISRNTDPQIVKRYHSGREFTVQIVMGLIDRSYARIRVVDRIHAEAKRPVLPQWRRLPMVRVVTEAIHFFGQALLLQFGFAVTFAFLFALAFFLQLFAGITG